MATIKTLFFYFILIVFAVHNIFNLERTIFITEAYSIFGFLALAFQKKYKPTKLKDNPESWLLMFIYYCTFIALVSIGFSDATIYEFVRTTTLVYSPLIFFLGFWIAKKTKKWGRPILMISIPPSIFTHERLSLAFSILGINSRNKLIYVPFILLALLVNSYYMNVSTPLLAAMLIITLLLSRRIIISRGQLFKKPIYISMLLGIALPAFAYLLLKADFEKFLTYGYSAFGDDIDNNAYWRLMYWQHLISQTLITNPITGAGFGTKLFSIEDQSLQWLVATRYSMQNQLVEYVLGPHNSLVFIFYRTGAIGLILFLGFLITLFYRVLRQKQVNIVILSSICILNTNMFFNVVLESPIWSINYWFVTGYLYFLLLRDVHE